MKKKKDGSTASSTTPAAPLVQAPVSVVQAGVSNAAVMTTTAQSIPVAVVPAIAANTASMAVV